MAVATEIGDAYAEWRAVQFLGECGLVSDAADVAMPWLRRALALARREGFAASEAICVYSLGVAHWILGDLDQAEELVDESVALFGALTDPRVRMTSPVNIAEVRSRQPGGLPGMRVVFEDTAAAVRRALRRHRRQLRAREPGRHRARARGLGTRALAARRERRAVRGARRRSRSRGRSGASGLPGTRARGRSLRRVARSSRRWSCAASTATRAASDSS